MRVAVIGAYGLVGSYVSARLLADGHEVVGVGRDLVQARRRFPAIDWKQADLAATGVEAWTALLAGATAVINCAGALQDSPRDDLRAVHVEGVRRLADACRVLGARLVHISAAGVEAGGPTAFNTTKHEAEALLEDASGLDWIILRPGLVLAPAAYGGTALLRGLAGFPGFVPVVHGDSRVQVVGAEDVAAAVARCLECDAPTRTKLDLVSDETVTLSDLTTRLRGWLGLPAAPVLDLPPALARITAVGADVLAFLGWRSPMRSAALAQLRMGVRGESGDAARLGLTLRSLDVLLATMPSGVQERWFARLYFAKPMILSCLFAFWLISGVIGLTVGFDAAVRTLSVAGVEPGQASAAVVGGSLVDIALALLVAHRRTAALALKGMLLVTAGYLAGGAIVRPDLWLDPMGPLIKSIPAAVLALAALAVLEER
ncbi:NAD(P)H-binding protein [Caulobacter segnis]|uniref:NAD(P)H-binding protein n=1 Tax=Caulobacter segnis TaxID=88688 RepID=UPI001CC09F7A|nr:NAD(P)H-binding protein [Caulobacter segnis]UAL09642.1 NAD(P)H-binding protein [Caulobacter segnis]